MIVGTATISGCLPSKDDVDGFAEMLKNKTEYVGDHNKVAALLGTMPELFTGFKQHFLSIQSQGTKGLTVYFEPTSKEKVANFAYNSEVVQTYAAMLFAFIGNIEELTFMVRDTAASTELVESEYQQFAHFTREETVSKFGDLKQFFVKEKFDKLVEEAKKQKESVFNFK
jgi:hypothetical protein